MALRPVVLIVPSMAAAVELPRRLTSTGRAIAGIYPLKLLDLARAVAEPELLGRGLRAWDTGHDALLAARALSDAEAAGRGLRLPPDLPRPPLAAALARTLSSLRLAGLQPSQIEDMAASAATREDRVRLHAVADLYHRFWSAVQDRFADPATILRTATERVGAAPWLRGAQVLVVDALELDGLEGDFLAALARAFPVDAVEIGLPPSLRASSFAAWAVSHGLRPTSLPETILAPLATPTPTPGLRRLREQLFEPPDGDAVRDGSVELMTAPGEGPEVRAVLRRLLREAARGVPFEEMGVILARPQEYAPLFTDLLDHLGIPYRLHPSLPLRFGRCARSLLLLFRCRGLPRAAVMEFLTFAPIPFGELLGDDTTPKPAVWDAIGRDAKIVSGLERWIIGLRVYAAAEREGARRDDDSDRRERRTQRADDALALLRLVELLSATLDALSGESSWPEWSERLRGVLDQWIGQERDRVAVVEMLNDLAGLGFVSQRAAWREVEEVLEARFEWERLPLDPITTGAVHVGALDAVAGLPFRVVAFPGLVEGGYPGVLRPDPFLLDPEREALAPHAGPPTAVVPRKAPPRRQLSLFDDSAPPRAEAGCRLPTTQDRLLKTRRLFHRALSQPTERLILSYPRADPRTGRERLPSLFLVAAASALEGRALSAADLDRLVVEDDLDQLSLDHTLDASERDQVRLRTGGRDAEEALASGSVFFRQSRWASKSRWSRELTPYDGLVSNLPPELATRLDPTTSPRATSASQLATFSRCGFLYLLQYVLRLDPVLDPEERKRLAPLERGSLFHEVAERYLRERRDKKDLPVQDTPETRRRLLALGDEALDALVAGSPPRFTFLWERERARFQESLLAWLVREAANAGRATPAYFEVSFGVTRALAQGEPHSPDPVSLDLGDGRTLRVSGKIDRIDRKPDGTLVLRDYKTGRAPRDDGGIFRGGKQLQIPFYILAAARLFPDQPVVEAFLDFVDGGRQVALDPAVVTREEFQALLRGLVDAIGQGIFAQEPTTCDFCDYTAVCGPKALIEHRRRRKLNDRALKRVLRLRDIR